MTALRHSLLARLLASSVLVAVGSITATAWLAVQGASDSISVEQGETLAVDTRIHDALLGYAAGHSEWGGVQAAVDRLAEETGRRIALTTENRRVLADSAAGPALPPRTSSVIDPLAVDVTFAPEDADRIDPRAVGPFRLSADERRRLGAAARDGADCLTASSGLPVEVTTTPSGRPSLDGAEQVGTAAWQDCGLDALDQPTKSERTALKALNTLIDACLEPHGLEADYRIDPVTGEGAVSTPGTAGTAPRATPRDDEQNPPNDEPSRPVPPSVPTPDPGARPGPEETGDAPVPRETAPDPADSGPPRESGRVLDRATPTPAASQSAAPEPPPEARIDPRIAACVDAGRREQLDPYVAPAALLLIDAPDTGAANGLALSSDGWLRVSGVVLLVLVLTVVVSVAVSARLIRPVRALTHAVRRMRAGEGATTVAVRDSGELGRLAAAFNEMSAHLERLEEQRKAMVSDVSHELRTPLSNLRGWLEAAHDGVAEMEPERVAMLVEETRVLQRIIDDLQDLALADAGRLRLTPEPVDLRELVEQAVASHRLRAESAGLRLVADGADGLATVADRTRLLQAVGNLLSNALRHTPAPGSVTVRARRTADGAAIEVIDTGVGIAPEDLPNVFSRFWRAEKSRSRRTGGSGLGLAIVRNLAELHGGSAEVTSIVGRGSTFTLRLPLTPPDAPLPGAPMESAGRPARGDTP